MSTRNVYDVADQAIGLFLEYRDQHGYTEPQARTAAVAEVLDGLRVCPTCNGSGRTLSGAMDCHTCRGTGENPDA